MCGSHGYIDTSDLDFIYLEDDLDRVVPIIRSFYPEGYSLNF
ncbi:MAG: TIGR00730 family Rossman fold protein, partial [Chlorobium sp.]